MSQEAPQPLIVEWSPSGVVVFDPVTRATHEGSSLVEVRGYLPAGRAVVLAVSRRSSFVKTVRVPNASAQDIELVLKTQMATLFPVPLSELAHSFKLTSDIDESGRLAVVAAMQASELRDIREQAKELGIRIARVVPAAFGSVLLADSLALRDCAIVQRSPEGLAIDIVGGGELRYSRATVMPASQAQIEAEVGRTFAASGLPCAPVVAAGGLSLAEADSTTVQSSLEALAAPGAERLGIVIELAEFVEAAEKRRQRRRLQMATLVLLAAMLVPAYAYTERSNAAAKVAAGQAQWAGTLTKLRKQRDTSQAEVATAQKLRAVVSRAFEPAQRPEDVVALVTNAAPAGMWLTGVTIERGKPLIFRGISTRNEAVADFLAKLSNEPRLRDVKLVFTNNSEIDKTPVIQFSVSAFPVGNLPLLDPKKKGAKR